MKPTRAIRTNEPRGITGDLRAHQKTSQTEISAFVLTQQ